ncbi:MAG: LacI family transcriptional regulator [Propionibacteriaceae bacterium]|jgi:DNA-binding LacI/PurR family transcriptional regulator|nr:LacI family transcriptional regulator [Propionibacteriaceae bacterium]
MAVSIEDVARAAGVSTATVSRALRGLPHVTPSTRAAVQAIADELGYTASPSASALASGRTRTVGLVVPAISRWFFAECVEGAEVTLRAAGFDALLYSLPDTARPRGPFDAAVLRRRVDAVLVASMSFSAGETAALRSLGVPAVFVSVPQEGFAHVGIDDLAGAVAATRHLVGLGHRVIAHIGGGRHDAPSSPTARRRAGWRQVLAEAGLEHGADLDAEADFTAEDGARVTAALLDRRPDLTAVFAASDEMAMGALRTVRERGLEPGRDVSVIGFDGHTLGSVLGLTTIAQSAHDQGSRAAEYLLDVLAGAPDNAPTALFPTELVVRQSTGPVPVGS